MQLVAREATFNAPQSSCKQHQLRQTFSCCIPTYLPTIVCCAIKCASTFPSFFPTSTLISRIHVYVSPSKPASFLTHFLISISFLHTAVIPLICFPFLFFFFRPAFFFCSISFPRVTYPMSVFSSQRRWAHSHIPSNPGTMMPFYGVQQQLHRLLNHHAFTPLRIDREHCNASSIIQL